MGAAGAIAVTCVSETVMNAAAVVPKRTEVAPVKPVPVSVTVFPPSAYRVGVRELIVGVATVTAAAGNGLLVVIAWAAAAVDGCAAWGIELAECSTAVLLSGWCDRGVVDRTSWTGVS